jgi:hypothetical protein
MEPEESISRPQEPATGPCPQEHESRPHLPTLLLQILVLSSYLFLDLRRRLFPSGFPIKILYTFLILLMRVTCPQPRAPSSAPVLPLNLTCILPVLLILFSINLTYRSYKLLAFIIIIIIDYPVWVILVRFGS